MLSSCLPAITAGCEHGLCTSAYEQWTSIVYVTLHNAPCCVVRVMQCGACNVHVLIHVYTCMYACPVHCCVHTITITYALWLPGALPMPASQDRAEFIHC